MQRSVITGTGSYIPAIIRKNADFNDSRFYDESNQLNEQPTLRVVEKLRQITGIEERRYAPSDILASDMAAYAALKAIEESGMAPESLDQLIVAHNYGDIPGNTIQSDTVPSLAARVKHLLGIRNPSCVAYDILFGCPGWLQALIQADLFGRAGAAHRCLVIGTETLSRVIDLHDRDSMIFSDGAGACTVEYKDTGQGGAGVLGTSSRSDCIEEKGFIYFGQSFGPNGNGHADTRFIKMQGRKVYEYALRFVPEAMQQCLHNSRVDIGEIKKIFIHQANLKMDEGIVKAFYALHGVYDLPPDIMPMCIQWLGNSSVATIPTLLDLVRKGLMPEHKLYSGDIVMFASVGAGMNINAVCYRY